MTFPKLNIVYHCYTFKAFKCTTLVHIVRFMFTIGLKYTLNLIMFNFLRVGDQCNRFKPFEGPKPKLLNINTMYHCSIFKAFKCRTLVHIVCFRFTIGFKYTLYIIMFQLAPGWGSMYHVQDWLLKVQDPNLLIINTMYHCSISRASKCRTMVLYIIHFRFTVGHIYMHLTMSFALGWGPMYHAQDSSLKVQAQLFPKLLYKWHPHNRVIL